MSKPITQPTTAQSLGALLKSARDIMRKDIRLRQGYGRQAVLNGDLDRLPMLTWIMFLKFLDDLEIQRRIVAEQDALQPEVEALKHLQAESRRRLHPMLDSLLPAILDRSFKGEL